MENPVAIEVTDLIKDIPLGQSVVHALRGVNVTIPRGEVVAIVGPSGSGKTTLLGLLGGLDVATSGHIVVNGIDITHLSENKLADIRNRQIGFVFQSFNLIPTLTALENVALPIQFGRGRNPMRRSADLLDSVGLSDRMNHKPSQLSGGEQQRVAIARALANDPAIILADEPTGNLDSANGERVMQQLLGLRVDLGKTVILVTHDPAIAVRTDRTIHLRDGLVVPDAGAEWTERLKNLTSAAVS
ncbi:MAG: efflux transporter, ATP-binding protein [Chloroflexi bacterium]|nr:efflux transporter, ATP-binding protein [Chloroflexota bacterium]